MKAFAATGLIAAASALKTKGRAHLLQGDTYWCDEAFQVTGGDQGAYDHCMSLEEWDRQIFYESFKTFWCDEAFQLTGGNQKFYDECMDMRLAVRDCFLDEVLTWGN